MTNPKPASPLPWGSAKYFLADDPKTVYPYLRDADGSSIAEFDCCDKWDFQDADYIVWAANNAPAMALRIERLEAALNHQRNKLSMIVQINPDTDSDPLDALRQAVDLAKAALEDE